MKKKQEFYYEELLDVLCAINSNLSVIAASLSKPPVQYTYTAPTPGYSTDARSTYTLPKVDPITGDPIL